MSVTEYPDDTGDSSLNIQILFSSNNNGIFSSTNMITKNGNDLARIEIY